MDKKLAFYAQSAEKLYKMLCSVESKHLLRG